MPECTMSLLTTFVVKDRVGTGRVTEIAGNLLTITYPDVPKASDFLLLIEFGYCIHAQPTMSTMNEFHVTFIRYSPCAL